MSQTKAQLVSGTTAQDLTVDNINTTSINSGQTSGNKNLVINGAMQVAQRGTSSTANGYGSVDRFMTSFNGTDESPTQAQVNVASGTTPYTLGFRKAFKLTNGNQTSGAGATDYLQIVTKLEAQDVAQSGWNYTSSSSFITLSFWVKSSVAQNFYGTFRTADGTVYSYPFETGSLSADTWTKVTKTIPGNSNLTFNNDNGVGIQIVLEVFRGTDYTGTVTLNQWGVYAGATATPDQTTTWYTTNDATFEITGVQLEVGSTASDFEHRSYGQELALCQRYFTRIPNQDASSGYYILAQAAAHDSNSCMCTLHFPVFMRTNPSISTPGSLRLYDGGGITISSLILNTSSVAGATLQISSSSGISRYTALSLGQDNDPDASVDFYAEL